MHRVVKPGLLKLLLSAILVNMCVHSKAIEYSHEKCCIITNLTKLYEKYAMACYDFPITLAIWKNITCYWDGHDLINKVRNKYLLKKTKVITHILTKEVVLMILYQQYGRVL